MKIEHLPMHVYALPLHNNGKPAGVLALFHDTTYIDTQVSHTLRDALLNALIQTLLITALAMILVRWTFTNPLTRTAKWLRTHAYRADRTRRRRCRKGKFSTSCTMK